MIDWRKTLRRIGIALNLRDPPNLPAYGWSYFDHLVAVYVTLNTADIRADAVIKKSHERPDDLKWGDIFLLENVIFAIQPPEVLQRNAWIIRERFREIACSTIYDKYVQSGIPKDADTPEKLAVLRADLRRVLDVLHWHYSLIPIREHIRKQLTSNCIWFVFAYTVALGVGLFFLRKDEHSFVAMVLCVLYFGIIGGFVSSQRRMQNIPTDVDPLISIFGLDTAGYYLWLSPLLGGIFAIILGLMFVGGILKGTVFPDFYVSKIIDPSGTKLLMNRSLFKGFALQALPTGTEEWAKLFIWSFLAGFAERLVPDNLDRLSAKLSASKATAPLPSPASPVADGIQAGKEIGPTLLKTEVSQETVEDALNSGLETPPESGE
jgi:hypothetical protein